MDNVLALKEVESEENSIEGVNAQDKTKQEILYVDKDISLESDAKLNKTAIEDDNQVHTSYINSDGYWVIDGVVTDIKAYTDYNI